MSGRLAETIVEGIAGAADGADRIARMAAVDGLTQAADMHVDSALIDIDFVAPDAVEKLLAREHAARALHQEFQEAEFGGPEIDDSTAAQHALLVAVELELAGLEHARHTLRTGAAQQGADARQEFRNRERLDNIVVGTRREPAHF